ncbi:MAG: DUF2973 domain-containing protein [Cyanobacteria bacterium J06641_5]
MLHLLYILAFTAIAFLAVNNLIRSLITVGSEAAGERQRSPAAQSTSGKRRQALVAAPHPEMMDERGRPIEEPLLVMKSVSVEDARARLDAIYHNSPSGSDTEE